MANVNDDFIARVFLEDLQKTISEREKCKNVYFFV